VTKPVCMRSWIRFRSSSVSALNSGNSCSAVLVPARHEVFQQREQLRRRASEAIETPDHQGVAGAQLSERLGQADPFRLRAISYFAR